MSEAQLINTLFDQLTKDVTADLDEQKVFYDENPHLFQGAPFDGIQPQIAHYLTQQKKQEFVNDYIKKLGQQMTIEVADTWTKEQSVAAKDNPLDKARQNSKPTLVMFYAESPCCPDATGPILAEVAKQFDDKLNVVTLNPNTAPILAARYNVCGNPTLLFYDAQGKEASREQGAMSREQITAKLAEMGVK
ncbi:MAG: thioredoxin family protein [Phycisphaerae bacterium]|nr:thioredoxin family protein [Phycisphaerae bacterium]